MDPADGNQTDTSDVAISLTVGEKDTTRYGWKFGSNDKRDKVRFQFNGGTQDLLFSIVGFDIDGKNEAGLWLNDTLLRTLRPGRNNERAPTTRVQLPLASQVTGTNQLEIRPSAPGTKYGVYNAMLRPLAGADVIFAAGSTDPNRYGYRYRGSSDYPGTLRGTLTGVEGHAEIRFRAFDIDNDDEISFYVNGNLQGFIKPTGNNQERFRKFIVAANVLAGGNRFEFRNARPTNPWGIRDVTLRSLPAQTLSLTAEIADRNEYGYRYGDSVHPYSVAASVARIDADVVVTVRGYDVDDAEEVAVFWNGMQIGTLQVTGNRSERNSRFTIARGNQQDVNLLEFRQRKAGEPWGIRNLRVRSADSSSGGSSSGGSSSGGGSSECTVTINPSDDLTDIVADQPAGATICIAGGTHRLAAIVPKDDQTYRCESDAILNGALRLDEAWTADGGLWSLTRTLPIDGGTGVAGVGQTDALVQIRNDLFIDDQPYRRVGARADVNADAVSFDGELMYAGTFYQDGDKLFVAFNPNGRKVEYSTVTRAFSVTPGQADRGAIENCTVEKYASEDLRGAIDLTFTRDWTVRNIVARLNHTGGMRTGVGTRVSDSRFIHNGQAGITGAQNDIYVDGTSADIEIVNIEAAYNNYLEFDPFWHAGGVKYFRTDGFTLRDSRIHHNYGPGVWLDLDVHQTTMTNNRIEKNGSLGIELEGVFNGVVSNNRVACNARIARHSLDRVWFWGSAIMGKNATGFEISNNQIIVDQGQGIAIVDNGDRESGPYGRRRSANNQVFSNTITFTSRARSGFFDGRTGVESDADALAAGLDATDPAANNQLFSNTFVYSDANHPHWRYDVVSYTADTIPAQWESGSTFDLVAADTLTALCD